jgi:hypothetical protein
VSVVPVAATSTDATSCHADDPPVSVGLTGAVWSMRAIPVTQLLNRPDTSTARNRTSVSPCDVTVRLAAFAGADQVAPPSIDVSR